MDERLSGMSNRFAGLPGDVALQGRLRQDLYRLVAGGARDYLPAYARAGGQWIEDLTNRRDILDAESLPTETDVPVFRFWGVQSRGNSLVVTVRDLLEGRSAPMMSQVEYWFPRMLSHAYGHWELPDAYEQMDTLDMILCYKPKHPEQKSVRRLARQFFKERLTEHSQFITRQRLRVEPKAPDGVYDLYRGEGSLIAVTLINGWSNEYVCSSHNESLRALLGKDAASTRRILKGFIGRIPRFYRQSMRPQHRFETAFVLRGDIDGGAAYCDFPGINNVDGQSLGWSSHPA